MHHTLTIVGNVGREPEMRYTSAGQAVCSFSVASNRAYTSGSGEKVKETIWFRVSTWGKQAETMNTYLKKGMLVLIEGRLSPDKATGNPRVYESKGGHSASYEVTAQTVRFLSKAEGEQHAQAEVPEEEYPF